ncbi:MULTISPECIES: PilW family protein [Halomonadaceae]|uniref:Prepilin-type N-terminal cleavage/methylation domain-containing protein n=1 Tax=Modicisalibacter zincidurans TaxID=1178777 RepID=A0ABP9R6X0_9GAMM|nr:MULTISPECIES: PilW family protein [Halomonas]MCD6009347.1 PilW family protein [Halomonas sp. IOP_31]
MSRYSPILPRHQRGLTLVELMISLVLGLLITAGIYQLFNVTQRTYRFEQAVADVQENGRFLINVFQRELRHSGFPPACQGASGPGESLTLNLQSSKKTKEAIFPDGRFDAIGGWSERPAEGGYAQQLDSGDYQKGDALLVHHAANPAGLVVDEPINIGDKDITLAEGASVKAGDIFALAFQNRCEVIENTQDGKLIVPSGFSYGFPPEDDGTWIGALVGDIYYIGWDDPRQEPGLRRLNLLTGQSETLASPVVDLEVRYLVDDNYQEAPDKGDWNKITAVRVSLLLRGATRNVLETPAQVKAGDIDFMAPDDDLRLYQGFTTTVALRNRLMEGKQ